MIKKEIKTKTMAKKAAEDIISAYLTSQKADGLTFHNDKPSARALYSPTFESVRVRKRTNKAI